MATFEGKQQADHSYEMTIITTKTDEPFSKVLLQGAHKVLTSQKINFHTIWVPTECEVPLVAKKIAESGNFEAIICLGATTSGTTSSLLDHLIQTSLYSDTPIISAFVSKDSNGIQEGECAARKAIEMANLIYKVNSTHEFEPFEMENFFVDFEEKMSELEG